MNTQLFSVCHIHFMRTKKLKYTVHSTPRPPQIKLHVFPAKYKTLIHILYLSEGTVSFNSNCQLFLFCVWIIHQGTKTLHEKLKITNTKFPTGTRISYLNRNLGERKREREREREKERERKKEREREREREREKERERERGEYM